MKVGIVNYKELLGVSIVAMVTFVAIRYLFISGFLPTHDGEYHLIRIYEFSRMLTAGHVVPRWAPGLNSGYGVPLFSFYYPLPNYIGSLFHFLGWSLADSFRLTMAVGYLIATIASYYWLKRLYGIFPATIGSIIGAFTPYWFVDIFVRGSVGEVLALGFVFAALASVAYEKRTIFILTFAAIILSHNIIAMIFLPVLALYVWITDRSLLRSLILGIIVTSYFWIPALMERGYVVGLNTVNYKDHFPEVSQLLIPSWGTGFSGPGYALDEMSYQIGIVPIIVVIAALIMLAWRDKTRKLLALFTGAVGIAFFLMLEVSTPVWERLPIFTNLQYPWRLLSIVIVATPFLAARLTSIFHRSAVSVALAAIAIMLSFSYTKPVLYAPRSDEYYLSRREFTDGTSSLGNGFSTRWMSWRSERPAKRMEIISGEGSIVMRQDEATTFVGDIVSDEDVTVRTNVAFYPGWRIVVDGKGESAKPDARGTISIYIPKGTHSLKVYFSETPLRFTVNLVSLVCLFWLISSTIPGSRFSIFFKEGYDFFNAH